MKVQGNLPEGSGSDAYGRSDWSDEGNIRL
jgi:hypothetical protein